MTSDPPHPSADALGNLGLAGVWRSSDPSVHEQAVKPWELLTDLPVRARFLHEMRYLSAPAFTIYEEHYGCPVRLRGQSPKGVIALAVPIRRPPTTNCWRDAWSAEQMPAIVDGPVDVLFGAGQKHLIVLVATSLARRELGEARCETLERLCRSRWLPSTEARMATLRDFLTGLIEAVVASPRLLLNPQTLGAIETDLAWHVFAAVRSHDGNPRPERANAARTGRARLVARALDYLRSSDLVDLSIPQLCAVVGVEQRSLEYAFRATFDLTPLGFLKLRRLHSARHRLLLADPADMAVSDIAYQEGFYNLGRFAAVYRSAFGEYPSETLRCPCPNELKLLRHLPPSRPVRRSVSA